MKRYVFALLFVLSLLVMDGYALGGSARAQALKPPQAIPHCDVYPNDPFCKYGRTNGDGLIAEMLNPDTGMLEQTQHIESGLAEEIINDN